MLTLTGRARARLVEALRQQTTDPEKAIRLVLAPSLSQPVGFILDNQEEGDQVVKAEDGSKVLLLGPSVGAALDNSLIDYCETSMGAAFTLCKLGPVQ
jgi:Fe-S cluster assembly iron-binding protein IscA